MSTRARILISFAACAALSLPATAASGATIAVNSTGDGAANDGTCTLREAITAANTNNASGGTGGECIAGSGPDVINFAASFTGDAGSSTISLGSGLPDITGTVTINGGTCTGPRPCVGIDANSANSAITVSAGNVAINGLAIFDASNGITGDTTAGGLTVKSSWFGIGLDLARLANTTGLELRGNNATIGGTTAADRNVFALSTALGLAILGGDNTVVQGNYFGTLADGDTTTNTGNITAIKAVTVGGNIPLNTVIGGADAGTPNACDGACNLISNSTSHGIDLQGNGSTEFPAGKTTIEGNFVGLDKDGTTDLSGTPSTAIRIGDADNVTVGGATTAQRNYVLDLIQVTNGATTAAVRNNFIGLNSAGSQRLGDGGSVGTALSAPFAGNVSLLDNRIAADPANNAVVIGDASTVRGNTIGIGSGGQNVGGGDTPMLVMGDGNTIGGSGAGEGNVMGNSNSGLSIAGDNNTVTGNKIGINANETTLQPINLTAVNINGGTDNQIGGTTAASENAIFSQTGTLIGILSDGTDRNSVLRNHGAAAAAFRQFIDVVPNFGAGVQALGANEGIQAPTITAPATPTLITGTGAEAGATVRVYRTETNGGQPADIFAFVGATVADGSGNWSLSCPSADCAAALPDSGQVTANQTDVDGNSSEMADVRTNDPVPETSITSGLADGGLTNDSTPTYGLSSNEPGASFQCRYDSGGFTTCSGPGATHTPGTPLSDGPHTFSVRATDNAGNFDASPATRTLTVDTVAPETTLGSAGPAEGSTTTDSTPSFDFSSNETATFECRLDGGAFGPCSGPGATHTPASPLADGAHTFEVRAADAAANVDASPAARGFTVDTVAPETTLGSAGPAEGSTTADSTPSFDFGSNETATFECRLDGGAFGPCSGPGNVHTPASPLADGAHTFEVRATDAAANVDASPAARGFTVDTTTPPPAGRSVSIESSKAKVVKGKKVKLSGRIDAPTAPDCESGQTVQLQRGPNAGSLTEFAEVRTDSSGAYSTKVKVKKTLQYRAVVEGSSACDRATSETVRVKAKRKRRR